MCTLAVYFRAFPEYPLVIAANRDEFLSRPSLPPGVIDSHAAIFGGRDLVHGGTWLGVNAHGVAAALLNRRSEQPPDPSLRSRGLLCLDALRCRSAGDARLMVQKRKVGEYNPFNLLVVDREEAWVATNHAGRFAVKKLTPGLHLLTNLDLDDPECPRIATSYQMFAGLIEERKTPAGSRQFVGRLRAILSTHDTALDPRAPTGNSLCLHAAEYGTRSSTVILRDQAGRWTYFHCDAPPCRGEYHEESFDLDLGAQQE
jgi:uncharacterized protein with NRDE domain